MVFTSFCLKLKRRYEIRTKQQIRYYKLKHDFEIYFKIYKTNLLFLVFMKLRLVRKNDYNKMKRYLCYILSPCLVEIRL